MAQVGARLGRDLERLRGRTLRGELEDARAVGVAPHLDGELPAEVLRRGLELEHGNRSQHRQAVELDAVWRMGSEEVALGLREELAKSEFAGDRLPDPGLVEPALEGG